MKSKDLKKRDKKIFELRQQGKTFKDIASLFNIGATRASQIYWREKYKSDNFDKWPYLKKVLSSRTQNGLVRYFEHLGYEDILNNPKEIAKLSEKEILRIKDLGKKSVAELLNALHALGYVERKD